MATGSLVCIAAYAGMGSNAVPTDTREFFMVSPAMRPMQPAMQPAVMPEMSAAKWQQAAGATAASAALFLGAQSASAGPFTQSEIASLTYEQIKGTGLANTCPRVEAPSDTAKISVGAGYKMKNFCLEPTSFQVLEEKLTKQGLVTEPVNTKVTTRQTYTLTGIEGTLASEDGKQGIAVTKMVDAYADLWWSRDGITWAQVGMAEGSERYICSTLEIFKIQEANEDFFLGKYSHTMVPFFYRHDVPVCGRPEKDATTGLLSPVDCAEPANPDPLIRRPDGDKKEVVRVPTLYFIGGDPGYLEGEDLGPQLTMFRSEANILCELDGIMCPTRTGSVAAYSTLENG